MLTPHQQIQALLEEADRRKRKHLSHYLDPLFHRQNEIISDQSQLQAWFCTRRAGKSMGAARKLLAEAQTYRNCNVLYIALTRRNAKGILWDDCLKAAAKSLGVPIEYNETELSAYLPESNSFIFLAGADAKKDEMEKFLGKKYRLVIIDEAASYHIDLRKLVYQVLKPAVADQRGAIILVGTPGDVTKGLFYDVTTNNEPGWKVHKWNTFDNPYMFDAWTHEIDTLKRNHPGIENTPIFKQMYLGEWFIDAEKLVYRAPESVLLEHLEPPKEPKYYILGVDLGYHPDPSAFVLAYYTDHDPTLYIEEVFQKTKMDIGDVAERIKYYIKGKPLCTVVVDAANKQAVETIQQRYGIQLKAADKLGKNGFIEIMNADLARGFIKLGPNAHDLWHEWQALVWDDSKDQRVEHSACANHLSDSCLYLDRKSVV